MRKLLIALQFLTIVPLKGGEDASEKEIGSSSTYFPFVGLAEGLFIAVTAMLLIKILPSQVVHALIVLLLLILNGGLHLDGLADTFDAIASRGDREKKLLIMKDSSIGPIGVIAIVMSLLLSYVMLNAVHFYSAGNLYYAILLLMTVSTRWAMVPALCYGRSARQDGLGRLFIENTGSRELLVSTFILFTIALADGIFFSSMNLFIFFSMMLFPALYGLSVLAVWFSKRHFDGLTGDALGAVNEITRLIFLFITVIWLQQSI
jgi:adenosylcobinamide-GDP ribazoletransferase